MKLFLVSLDAPGASPRRYGALLAITKHFQEFSIQVIKMNRMRPRPLKAGLVQGEGMFSGRGFHQSNFCNPGQLCSVETNLEIPLYIRDRLKKERSADILAQFLDKGQLTLGFLFLLLLDTVHNIVDGL